MFIVVSVVNVTECNSCVVKRLIFALLRKYDTLVFLWLSLSCWCYCRNAWRSCCSRYKTNSFYFLIFYLFIESYKRLRSLYFCIQRVIKLTCSVRTWYWRWHRTAMCISALHAILGSIVPIIQEGKLNNAVKQFIWILRISFVSKPF